MVVAVLFAVLALFALGQFRVLVLARRSSTRELRRSMLSTPPDPPAWPAVAVLLPVYRESAVLERLITGVAAMDYLGPMTIHVLDDSEDDEARRSRSIVQRCAQDGVSVDYANRSNRIGYKAGALNRGFADIDADLIAIFDADFVPDRDFLHRVVPYLAEDDVAAVHTRWRHRHGDSTSLATMQVAVLDTLFLFANAVRQLEGEPTMYLGTCGLWRVAAIRDIGGWKESRFTDDGIDLSVRAQVAGWRLVYLNDALATADLPATYVAYENQQRRWARGALRLALDHGRTGLRPPGGLGRRLLEISSLHMVSGPVAIVAAGLVSGVAVALGRERTAPWKAGQVGLGVALLLFTPAQESLLAVRLLYDDWPRRWLMMLPAFPLAIGMSAPIAFGFRDSLSRDEPEFVRTPKCGAPGVVGGQRARWRRSGASVAIAQSATAAMLGGFAVAATRRQARESYVLLFGLAACQAVSAGRSWRDIASTAGG